MNNVDLLWDDNPIDITSDANFIWGIANKLRGTYMPDKYGDVIIPMTILRRLECALKPTKKEVVAAYENNPTLPPQKLEKLAGYQFYNTSHYTLKNCKMRLINWPRTSSITLRVFLPTFKIL